jgi:hypothetical protein
MLNGMSTNNTPVDLPQEALAIAAVAAAAQGMTVREWLMRAISHQAAEQKPVIEIPFDDGGFDSPILQPVAA